MSREETPCSVREDGQHCDCWYDGDACCACADPADPADVVDRGELEATTPLVAPRPSYPVQFVVSADPDGEAFSWSTTLDPEVVDKAKAYAFIYRALGQILKRSKDQQDTPLLDMPVSSTVH